MDTSTSHTSDPPVTQNETNNAESSAGPSHAAPANTTTDENAASDAKQSENERNLKKTWLSLLPIEQVVDIAMKLDELVPRKTKTDIWPKDLRAAVFQTAVARIMESTAKGKAHDALKSLELTDTTQKEKEPTAVGNGAAQRREQSAQAEATPGEKPPSTNAPSTSYAPSLQPPASTSYTPAATATTTVARTETPAPRASSAAPSTAVVPPLTTTIMHTTPATSTTSYQAASVSYGYSYPYTSGSYSYQHSANHQPYSYSYAPSAGSTSYSPAPAPAPPIPPTPKPVTIVAPDDEDDLPSYEEMLAQALMVHNDPAGVAPKQLFQWMAATYPLQANFRPSASQALQKAFKRGRFEKNKEGKYRLNARWEGGNTSRRTTRRPQSYSKAVTNPSPSSHPPTNTSQYLPQHYSWTYGPNNPGGKSHSESQSPAPPPTPAPAPRSVMDPEKDLEGATPMPDEESTVGVGEVPWNEAAFSIVAAIGRADKTNRPDGTEASADTINGTTAAPAAMDSPYPVSQLPSDSSFPTSSAANPYAEPGSAASRAALQGSLALLAAQLAEIAGDANPASSVAVPEWPTPAEASAVSASASASSALNMLDGFGLDMFGSSAWAGLRGAAVDVKQ